MKFFKKLRYKRFPRKFFPPNHSGTWTCFALGLLITSIVAMFLIVEIGPVLAGWLEIRFS